MSPMPRQCVSILTALVVFAGSVCCTCASTSATGPVPQGVRPAAHVEGRHRPCCARHPSNHPELGEQQRHSDSNNSHCPHCARPQLASAPPAQKVTARIVDFI